jgi:hypothetical protein
MQMRARSVPRGSHAPDGLLAAHAIALAYKTLAEVCVQGFIALCVLDQDNFTVASVGKL